jgi:hypothetical protein
MASHALVTAGHNTPLMSLSLQASLPADQSSHWLAATAMQLHRMPVANRLEQYAVAPRGRTSVQGGPWARTPVHATRSDAPGLMMTALDKLQAPEVSDCDMPVMTISAECQPPVPGLHHACTV